MKKNKLLAFIVSLILVFSMSATSVFASTGIYLGRGNVYGGSRSGVDFDVAAYIYYNSNTRSYIDFESFVCHVYNYGADPVDYADYMAHDARYNQNVYWRQWWLDARQGQNVRDELFFWELVSDGYIYSTRFDKNNIVRTQILGCIGDVVVHGTFETIFDEYGRDTEFFYFAGFSEESVDTIEEREVLRNLSNIEETALLENQETEITAQLELGASTNVDSWLNVSDVKFVEYLPSEQEGAIDLSDANVLKIDFTANDINADKFPRKGFITINGEKYNVLSTTTSFDENNNFTDGSMLFVLPPNMDVQMQKDSGLNFDLTITDIMEIK